MNLHARANRRAAATFQQTRQTTTSESTTVQEILLAQSEKIAYQQGQLNDLGKGFKNIAEILQKQQQSNPAKEIEAVRQDMRVLGRGLVKVYQDIEGLGKELKTGQQNLQKVVEANQNKTTPKTNYLDWQQIAIIVAATALISSLCSLAVFQLASNWNTDQPQNPVEKPLKPKGKKSSK
jgi:aldehyde:ferredoxin oxidoreductase